MNYCNDIPEPSFEGEPELTQADHLALLVASEPPSEEPNAHEVLDFLTDEELALATKMFFDCPACAGTGWYEDCDVDEVEYRETGRLIGHSWTAECEFCEGTGERDLSQYPHDYDPQASA